VAHDPTKKAITDTMGLNAICVHGHFYQPPREDPLTGQIPEELGAQPYNNWNERIHAECYRANANLGNFEKISFNIGPTLLRWMEFFDKDTYESIIAQENNTYQRFGVGNGIAQAYNHVILPLADKCEKVTQIKWGIADFIHRFGHKPTGMWLPETAVDLETLSTLSDNDISFTILAPWQIKEYDRHYSNQPYLVELPGEHKPMTVFVYDQNLSTSVSFQSEATNNAERFVDYWISPRFNKVNQQSENMRLIASDGELYGHHKIFRDKFLSHLLNGALHQRNFEITYPGLWLRDHPAEEFVEINENTSWSCHHGVSRWMDECGCTPGAAWKAPLRKALNDLARDIDQQFKSFLRQYTNQVWTLRDEYIHVLLNDESFDSWLRKFINQDLSVEVIRQIRMLLTAQFERQRMFTSCGWFFSNFDRIEPKNNIAYTAQALWLTKQAMGVDLQQKALDLLSKVKDQHTGLSCAEVFAKRYHRTQNYSDHNLAYFNAFNNLST
jgi:hypothetical protein